MNKPHWFPFFPNDFLSSSKVMLMGHAEIGAYILLLCHMWNDPKCTLPNDDSLLQKLTRFSGDFSLIKSCFSVKGDRLVNARLMHECKKTKAIRRLRAKAGRKGGQAHAQANATAKAQAPAKQESSILQLQLQSQLQEIKKEENTCPVVVNGRDYRTESKQILQFLNEKSGKKFREIEINLRFIELRLKSGVDVQTCKSLIARKVRDWGTDPKMCKYLRPETLFNPTKFETYLAEVS